MPNVIITILRLSLWLFWISFGSGTYLMLVYLYTREGYCTICEALYISCLTYKYAGCNDTNNFRTNLPGLAQDHFQPFHTFIG